MGYSMKIKNLLNELDYDLINGSLDCEIKNIRYDSRKVDKNDLFICIAGTVRDSHDYIADVVAKGAGAIVVTDLSKVPSDVLSNLDITIIKVSDSRLAMALISTAYFDFPAKKLITIAITGTKGKTTTTYMIRSVLEKCGVKCGLIGTIESIIGDEKIPSENTTPESYIVNEYFDKMVKCGCKAVVMEVSSQAFLMSRVAGIEFDYAIFTNLSQDHVGPGEHESFEDYAACKAMLFKQSKVGIFNNDEKWAAFMMQNATCQCFTYGVSDSDYMAKKVELFTDKDSMGVAFDLAGKANVAGIRVRIPGDFTVHNALAACAVAHMVAGEEAFGKYILSALSDVRVKGRAQLVPNKLDIVIMIDYAHNAVSLESLLMSLRKYNVGRIITIFGCGGNRSRDRRFLMGEVSSRLSDLTVATSDNPRDEEPQDILNDVITGINKAEGEYVAIIDRQEAVDYAVSVAKPGDIIVLAGKGHEDYQIIKGVKYHMDEEELVLNALSKIK